MAPAAIFPTRPYALPEDSGGSRLLGHVKIDQFQVTNTTPENSDLNLEFTLTAIVSRSAEESFKEAVNDLQKYRVRQAVERVCRSATREELEDPVHSTIKRLMKEEINKILGKSYIIDIIISDYQIREL